MAVHWEEGGHSSEHGPPHKQGEGQAKNLGEAPAD